MALPTEGELSFSAIATELSISLTDISLRNMSSLAGFTTPDNVSEFYEFSAVPSTITIFVNTFRSSNNIVAQIVSSSYEINPLPNGGYYGLRQYWEITYYNYVRRFYFDRIYPFDFTFNNTQINRTAFDAIPSQPDSSVTGAQPAQGSAVFVQTQNPSAPPSINV